jgi:hypothetical protein
LHPHERVHLHSERFFNAQGHVPGKVLGISLTPSL